MKNLLLLIVFILIVCFQTFAQEIERIEINGRINVESEDIEGITVYNSSINRGTVTDSLGVFTIMAGLNDVINFGALQFKDFSVTIDKRIMSTGKMTVILVEQVNKLDEVLILPYDLTGNLIVDLNEVRTYNVDMKKIYLGIGDLDDYEFTDDNKSKVDNPFTNREFKNGLNLINVGKLLVGALSKNKSENESQLMTTQELAKLASKYDANYLNERFEIPIDKADDFYAFLESKSMDKTLLLKENEILLLEYISQQSQLFLIENRD